jgi:hypothetical protein
MKLNINTDAVVIFTNKLEKIHRSALPVAVRASLNSAAFDVKKRTLLKETSESFTIRQKNFFKANSRVEQAQGFNMNTMRATIGMVEGGLKGGNNYAVKDLEQQERGGTIKGKAFIPLKAARVGGSDIKVVRPQNRLSAINKVVNARKTKGVSDKQKFNFAAHQAGIGGYVLAKYKAKEILWRVNSLEGKIKLTPLYSYKEKRSVSVKPKGFMQKASMESAQLIEKFFILEAKKQIAKYADR